MSNQKMGNLQKKLKEIPEIDFPAGLHGKIMKRIYFYRLSGLLWPVVSLLALNSLFAGWGVWARTVELDSAAVLHATLDGFEWSASFGIQLWEAINESLPVSSITIFLLNTAALLYIIYIFYRLSNKFPDVSKGRAI